MQQCGDIFNYRADSSTLTPRYFLSNDAYRLREHATARLPSFILSLTPFSKCLNSLEKYRKGYRLIFELIQYGQRL